MLPREVVVPRLTGMPVEIDGRAVELAPAADPISKHQNAHKLSEIDNPNLVLQMLQYLLKHLSSTLMPLSLSLPSHHLDLSTSPSFPSPAVPSPRGSRVRVPLVLASRAPSALRALFHDELRVPSVLPRGAPSGLALRPVRVTTSGLQERADKFATHSFTAIPLVIEDQLREFFALGEYADIFVEQRICLGQLCCHSLNRVGSSVNQSRKSICAIDAPDSRCQLRPERR